MSYSKKDNLFIWHPYTQHALSVPVTGITKAKGSYLYDEKGNKIIDAVSSWWTNVHGHSHPAIVKAVSVQIKKLDHVIFAGFTHEPAILLAEKLLKYLPANQKKVFYSDNGSTAVEVAIKMSLQYWKNKGVKRTKIIAFKNAYHGDTFGAMSASERGLFTKPFNDKLFDVIFIDVPTKENNKKSISLLKKYRSQAAAFIFEPLVQGAGGMLMHEAKELDKLIDYCKKNKILTIADEVMTGFGRTGKMFASDHLKNKADIFCLSKGLTGGVLPLGVTSCTNNIYKEFYSKDSSKTFFHGHSFTANPVSCASALASLTIFEEKRTWTNIERIALNHQLFALIASGNKRVKEVRVKGTILAIELKDEKGYSYLNSIRNKAYSYFLSKGILLRPLGNVIYILPPYCISTKDLEYIYKEVEAFLNSQL